MIITKDLILNNGNTMPRLGIGCDTLKGDDVINSVIAGIKAGYRMIDTASLYRNEKEVGIAIQQCINDGIVQRQDLFISSKAPYFFPGYQETLDGYKHSLENLGLDYLDLYLLHHPYREYFSWQKEIVHSWQAMEYLYKTGLVKNIGVCNFSWPYFDVLLNACEILPQINQIEVHPEFQYKDAVELSKHNGIQVVAWSALNKGHILSNEVIIEIANKLGKSPAQVAIRWNLQKENAVLIRSTKPERLKANSDVWDFELTAQDMEKLDSIKEDELFHGHQADSIPIGMMPKRDFDSMLKTMFPKPNNKKKYYKLFGFIPFLKEVIYSDNKIKWYLFGIPIIKIIKKKV